MAEKFKIVVKTFHGLEKILADEIKGIGGDNIQLHRRAVSFTGDTKTLYKANFHLRTALKVLRPIFEFKAKNEVELYDGIFHYNWDQFLTSKDTLAIDTVVLSNFFKHSKFVSYKVKDAIVDQIRKATGKRPSVNIAEPTYRINVHIANDECTVSLDSSGESLHRRGYRVQQGIAPLNEVLAAGMIKLTNWKADCTLIDPMCGSGTILIEAALIANNIPPGIFRKQFGFELWNDFDDDLFQDIINEDYDEGDFPHEIIGSDISADTIKLAMYNVKSASLSKKIELKILPFDKFIPSDEKGIVITNPPYGQRIKNDDIHGFYKMIGDNLKNHFTGYEAWVLTNNDEPIKSLGLHPTKKITLYNGALECKFQRFSIYKGSIKSKYQKNKQGNEHAGAPNRRKNVKKNVNN